VVVTDVTPVPPPPIGKPVQLVNMPLVGVPNNGVTITMLVLVQAEILPEVTVPNRGVTNVGDVANTAAPVPVSSVNVAAKLALVGVAKNVAMPVAKLAMPVLTGNPVQLVNVPLVGVPKSGVTSVGDVFNTMSPVPVVVIVYTPPVPDTRSPSIMSPFCSVPKLFAVFVAAIVVVAIYNIPASWWFILRGLPFITSASLSGEISKYSTSLHVILFTGQKNSAEYAPVPNEFIAAILYE